MLEELPLGVVEAEEARGFLGAPADHGPASHGRKPVSDAAFLQVAGCREDAQEQTKAVLVQAQPAREGSRRQRFVSQRLENPPAAPPP